MLTTLTFLIILSLLVFVHEAGHFIAAKRSGVLVEEFGFGYPPRVFGIKYGETLYSINLLPFGGFVRLYGEDDGLTTPTAKEKIPKKRAYYQQSPIIKALMISAGVAMNFLLAVVVFGIAYSITGIPVETNQVNVVEVAPGSPAAQLGFQNQDQILAVGTQPQDLTPVTDTKHFLEFVNQHLDQPIYVQILRAAQPLNLSVTPRSHPPEGQGPLGVTISSVELRYFPWWQMPIRGAIEGFQEALAWTRLVITMLASTLSTLITQGVVSEGVAGPVEIYRLTGQVVKFGFVAVLRFIGILSVNLAVVNILPIPALDGGRLVFVIIEAIRGKRPDPSLERTINTVGVTLLIILLLLITMNDLVRIFGKQAILTELGRFLPL
jgi:regulator of sigma E protease